jgi:hypothetical protein
MRTIGYLLLNAGFLWIVWDSIHGFVAYQHSRWIWQSQQLPTGETLRREDAMTALRTLSLELKDRHRIVLIPSFMMLAGACLLTKSRQQTARRPATAEQVTPPNHP